MKLLVWNINALAPTARNAVHKYGSWAGFFQHHGLDMLALQESKVIDEKLTKELACVDGFQSFWACSREKKGYSGVATYASEAWAPLSAEADCLGSGEDDIDREGRIVVTDHGAFVLINVYVPNSGDRPARARLPYKLRFLEALRRKCDDLAAAGRQLLIVGDFNIPAEPRDMHPSLGPYEESYGEEERAALAGLMASYPDVWRRLHPEESSTYTVWNEKTSARAFNQGLRIDYVLASPALLDRVVSCEVLSAEVLPPKWSDHAGILLELSGVDPPAAHPPCKAWQALHKRFNDTSQRSILSMFGKKRPAEPAAAGKAAGGGGSGDKGVPARAGTAAAAAAACSGAAGSAGGAATAGAAVGEAGRSAAETGSSRGQQGDEQQEQQQQQSQQQQEQQQSQQQQEQQPPAKKPRQADAAAAEELSSGNAGAEAGVAGGGTQQKAGGGGSGGRRQAASGGKGKGKAAQNGQPKEAAAGQRTIGSFFKSSQ